MGTLIPYFPGSETKHPATIGGVFCNLEEVPLEGVRNGERDWNPRVCRGQSWWGGVQIQMGAVI